MKCTNETFATQNEAIEAGFNLRQCILGVDCNCNCNIVEDQICDQNSVIGSGQQNCKSVEICDTVEEEICTEDNGNTMQVLLRQSADAKITLNHQS